ncbi:SGNH/GDSL hydrolase family protein [Streptomyces gamaensis]|uniref:SGNH/GDSL hydrolase family protein n=1 Tax=Streptomyces gamaensis TaxID=1763542 RepID=A0ABW0YUG3_9ACTN
MHINTTISPARRPRTTAAVALAAGVALLAVTGCGSSSADADRKDSASASASDRGAAGKSGKKLSKLLWMGDSIAEAEAPAIGAALKAGGVEVKSMAAAGGGGVVGEIGKSTWDQLPGDIGSFRPDVIAYQITTYDWGTADEQRAAYEKLAKTAADAGAELVLVSAPPFRIDDFYKKHESEIATASKAAKEAAEKNPDTVRFLDASALWGTDSADPKALRSKDGIHSCQQGSAAFANWLGGELGSRYGFTPAAPDQWAKGSWTGDKVYANLGCS